MFVIDDSEKSKLNANICVVGIGGGGSNAVETMVKSGIEGVKFIVVNTDAQALQSSSVNAKIQLGAQLTKGLGAGANPDVGRRAAIESYDDIVSHISGSDMVFVTAGMGGGTGTGGVSIIAEAAKELGALTVGVVTTPFDFEGSRRRKHAEQGLEELKKHVDTLIVIPNEKLLLVSDEDTPLLQTFQKTDDILLQAVKGIAELISLQGLINLDFADVRTVMSGKGMALMGIGTASGKGRAEAAVAQAISSPLLEDVCIQGSTGIIVNVTGGSGLSLKEVHKTSALITQSVDPDADIIVGAVVNENMGDSLSVTVIATGFSENPSGRQGISLAKTLRAQSPTSQESFEQVDNATKKPEIPKPEVKKDKPKEIWNILSDKAKEYAENNKSDKPGNTEEKNMDWLETKEEETSTSPFEGDLNFTEEDLY